MGCPLITGSETFCVLNHTGDDSNDLVETMRSSSITGVGAFDGHAAGCLETRCLDVTTTGRVARSVRVISASMESGFVKKALRTLLTFSVG